MARVTGHHWFGVRLRHIANKKSRPVIKAACVVGEAFKKVQQPRMTPIAVARKSHHLPVGTVDREGYKTTSTGVKQTTKKQAWSRRESRHRLFSAATLLPSLL